MRAYLLLLPLLCGCALLKTVETECSERRPCAAGQVCDPDTATCRPGVGDGGTGDDLGADLRTDADLAPGCSQESECLSGLACKGRQCVTCLLNDDCESRTCDLYQLTRSGLGRCLAEGSLVYVDNKQGTCAGSHAGTQSDPMCSLDQAISALGGAKTAIRVLSSSSPYPVSGISGKAVRFYGPAGQGGKATIGNTNLAIIDALSVYDNAEVLVDGFEISRSSVNGVECTGGGTTSVTLRRSRIFSEPVGVSVSECKLEMDRMRIENNGSALAIAGTKPYTITNSFLIDNNAPSNTYPVELRGPAGSTFAFNTVAGNQAANRTTINCSAGTVIEHSIIFSNAALSGTQLTSLCMLSADSLVGRNDTASGGVKQTPKFQTLADPLTGTNLGYGINLGDPVNQQYVIDRAGATGPATDYLGNRRPLGAAHDVGAQEVE